MSGRMRENNIGGLRKRPPPLNTCNIKQKTNAVNCCKNPTQQESLVCCPDLQTTELDESDSAYQVVNINLKECATKLLNNLFGSFSFDSTSFFDGISDRNFSDSVCDVPGCNYNGDRMMRKEAVKRSCSETSSYNFQKPNQQNDKLKRMKTALKWCVQEKIARPKICDSFLIELQQVLAKYPYTDLRYYWELLRAIQAEIDNHRCKKGPNNERVDEKSKQLYMLSYAITRLILQLDFITGGNPRFPFRKSRSWSQIFNQCKDFHNPVSGQFSMNPFPRLASSIKANFLDGTNQKNLCSCLPLGFFSRAIGVAGYERENNCLNLKVDSFPDEFTCFDLESLTYLIDNLDCDLQLECRKGFTGQCQVPNCPYPVPVKDEKIIKELRLNIYAIEQLIFFLQRIDCFTVKVSPMRNHEKSRKPDEPCYAKVPSKSILKNRSNPMYNNTNNEVATFQMQFPPSCPEEVSKPNSRCCSPIKEKNSTQTCVKNETNFEIPRSMSPNLQVIKVVPPKLNRPNKIVDLCSSEPPKIRKSNSRRGSPKPKSKRSRSGASRSSQCSAEEDLCKKCKKINVSCHQYKEKKEERKKKRKDSGSEIECDFSFRVKAGEKIPGEKITRKHSEACQTDNISAPNRSFNCKAKKEDNIVVVCCNADSEPESNLISSVAKCVKKMDSKISPAICDPDNKSTESNKTQKCIEKLKKSSKSNVEINDCKHKKDRIIRLVGLLSNTDCTFKPTNASNNTCKNELDQVCELYDKFLSLENDENSKKKGQLVETSCAEKLKIAFECLNRAKSPQTAPNNSTCDSKRKASIGIQACSDELCPVDSALKQPETSGTCALDSNCAQPLKTLEMPQSDWAEPSKSANQSDLGQPINMKDHPLTTTTEQTDPTKQNISEIIPSANSAKVCRIVNSKSIECLRKKLESKYKTLSKQQQENCEKIRKAAEKKKLKEVQEQRKPKCFRCRISKSAKLMKERQSKCLGCCKSNTQLGKSKSKSSMKSSKSKCSTRGPKSKSKCSLKSCKSKTIAKDSKLNCSVRCCKSKCRKAKCSKKIKSLSEIFSSKTDPCLAILEIEGNACKRKQCSPLCKGRNKSRSKSKKPDTKIHKCESKLKERDSQLKITKSKLKKSCAQLKKCDSKLKKFEAEIKKCQSELEQCDEAKRRLEKCTSVLLKRLSRHEADSNSDV